MYERSNGISLTRSDIGVAGAPLFDWHREYTVRVPWQRPIESRRRSFDDSCNGEFGRHTSLGEHWGERKVVWVIAVLLYCRHVRAGHDENEICFLTDAKRRICP